jgi:hypothetical protein
LRKISAVVDSAVHRHELFRCGFVFHARIMQGRVQHYNGKTENVTRVRVDENIRIELAVALREAFHHTIDLLRFARQSEAP